MRTKKLWPILVILALVQLACTLESQATVGVKPKPPSELAPVYATLPDGSEYVGTYETVRNNGNASWNDDGTFTVKEYEDAHLGIRCGTKYAEKIKLSAAKGYHWKYYESKNMAEGYFLEKDQ